MVATHRGAALNDIRLHLGCGDIHLPGWTNIDIRDTNAVDLVEDIGTLPSSADRSADIIYACHVLDHFSRHAYMDVLRRWYAVLKPGGILRLSVVDFADVVERYRETRDVRGLIGLLHARQDYPSNVRHMSWDYRSLGEDLLSVGFSLIRPWKAEYVDHGHIHDCSQARMKLGGVDQLISLNIEGVK